MFLKNFFKYFVVVLLLFSMIAMNTSCASKKSDFPQLPTPETTETEVVSSIPDTTLPTDNYKLTFALPYSETTVNYLFKYYYVKQNGLVSNDETGATISLDFLDSIKVPYSIENIYVPDTGASASSIKDMGKDAPDLFLTSELDVCISEGLCTSLNEYASKNSLFDSDYVYVSPLMNCVKNENLYAIPHYMSIPVIMGNIDFVPSEKYSSFKISLNTLSDTIDAINAEDNDDVVCFYNAKSLYPYLGSSFNNKNNTIRSYMLENEFRSDDASAEDIFDNVHSYIENLYDSGLSIDFNEDGSVPTYSRNAALWVVNSNEISYYSSYYPNKTCLMQIPTFADSDDTVPYVTVYPLCVSASSMSKDIVSDFATFISIDSDALLLINRLEAKSGMLPVVSTPSVWDSVISDEDFGYVASLYENEMYRLVCSNEVVSSKISVKTDTVISDYYQSDDNDKTLDLVNIYG